MATLAKDGKSLLEAVDDCRSQSSLYSPNIERMLAQQQQVSLIFPRSTSSGFCHFEHDIIPSCFCSLYYRYTNPPKL